MNIVLFESAGKQKYNAGSKARQDALQIAKRKKYQHVVLFHNGKPKLVIIFEMLKGIVISVFKVKKEENILIQHPYSPSLFSKIIYCLLRLCKIVKKYNVTVLIHDLEGLRYKRNKNDSEFDYLRRELHSMRGFTLIYHNAKMSEICESVYPSYNHKELKYFDYLYSSPIETKKTSIQDPIIVIAGNLSEKVSGFLYNIPTELNVNIRLYGTGYSGTNTDKITYCGSFPPEELIKCITGHFGLIWYGKSCSTCDGDIGKYLPYISPHKFSMYLAAGIPVVVWSKSALSEIVTNKRIGFAIDSLIELPGIMLNLTDSDYNEMCKNVLKIRSEIVLGNNLWKLLD